MNKNRKIPKKINIHISCRTKLKNSSRKKLDDAQGPPDKKICQRLSRASTGNFMFNQQCFYCEKPCSFDERHPDRKNWSEVRIINGDSLHDATLQVCKSRQDEQCKKIELRLLSFFDVIARYHWNCKITFERSGSDKLSKGRTECVEKVNAFELTCKKLENFEKIYTLKEFAYEMKEYTGESYTSKTIENKLQDKYGTKISFCEKEGFSSLIVLVKIAHLITQEKHRSREIDEKSEAKKIVLLAAELIKESIMKFDDKIDCYPSIGEIENDKTDEVPELLKELVNDFEAEIFIASNLFWL